MCVRAFHFQEKFAAQVLRIQFENDFVNIVCGVLLNTNTMGTSKLVGCVPLHAIELRFQ